MHCYHPECLLTRWDLRIAILTFGLWRQRFKLNLSEIQFVSARQYSFCSDVKSYSLPSGIDFFFKIICIFWDTVGLIVYLLIILITYYSLNIANIE